IEHLLAALAAATIFSKRGWPGKASQHGLKRRSPCIRPAGIFATISICSKAKRARKGGPLIHCSPVRLPVTCSPISARATQPGFGNADRSVTDRTLDRAGAAQG